MGKRDKRRRKTRHHLTPKSRLGARHHGNSDKNILTLWDDKHRLFHKLFGNRTLEEVIILLQRIKRIKGR